MPDIFLSYSRADRRFMEPLRDYLVSRGLDVWTDEALEPGTSVWFREIDKAIRESHIMLVLMSPHLLEPNPDNPEYGSFVLNEVQQALDLRKKFYTILLDGDEVSAVPLQLKSINWVDVRGRYVRLVDEMYSRLAQQMANYLGVELKSPPAQHIHVTVEGDISGTLNVSGHDIFSEPGSPPALAWPKEIGCALDLLPDPPREGLRDASPIGRHYALLLVQRDLVADAELSEPLWGVLSYMAQNDADGGIKGLAQGLLEQMEAAAQAQAEAAEQSRQQAEAAARERIQQEDKLRQQAEVAEQARRRQAELDRQRQVELARRAEQERLRREAIRRTILKWAKVLVVLLVVGGIIRIVWPLLGGIGGGPATPEPTTPKPTTPEPATMEPVTTEPVTPEPATPEPATPEPLTPALSASDCTSAGLPVTACTGATRNADWTPYTEEINGVLMALVPAGCFQMGNNDGADDEQPIHQVCFEKPYWVDVYEVTNKQYGSTGCEESSSSPDQPRNCVDWTDALAHCLARGARLPTEAEWEYAARGPDGLVYPWGNEFASDNVVWNTSRAADVGSKPGGVSWIGAYDLSSNVWEWVADWYGTYPSERQVNPEGPNSGEYRVLRGGSWDISDALLLRADCRFKYFSIGRGDGKGFRCALSD